MWHTEALILQVSFGIMVTMVFFLTIEQISNRNRRINIIVRKFLPLVIIFHVLSINVAAPVAFEQFNIQNIKILTFDFFSFSKK
jgi:hypothetical protein